MDGGRVGEAPFRSVKDVGVCDVEGDLGIDVDGDVVSGSQSAFSRIKLNDMA